MQDLSEKAVRHAKPFLRQGKLADYIPALTRANATHLGISVMTVEGKHYTAGDVNIPFSIQSISKILSLVQLEYEYGKPRNPLINVRRIS